MGCAKCGRANHKTSDCFKGAPPCAKCGRTNHKTSDCYAATPAPLCAKCGRSNHKTSDCYAGKAKISVEEEASPESKNLPSFDEVLAALRPFHRTLGGTPKFGHRDPFIPRKLKSSELESNSNYEYVFLSILGFQ